MKIAIIYPENLPSQSARTVTVAKTASTLGKISETTLICEKTASTIDDISSYYGIENSFRLVMLPKKLLLRSNKIFNFFLIRHLRKTRYDAIYVRHLKTAKMLIKAGFKVVFEAHEIFADSAPEEKKTGVAKSEKYVYENCNGIVFISQTLKEEFLRRYTLPSNITLPLCFSEQIDGADKKEFAKLNEVYYVGSFQPWKGVDTLIKSAKYIPDNTTIKLVGSGGEEEALKNLAKEIGVEAKIEFLGRLPHAKVEELLKTKSKICVLPNNKSPFDRFTSPLKLFEYMASFNAIIASDIQSIREITNGATLEFEAGNEKDLGEKISYLAANPNIAREFAQNSYMKISELEPKARAKKLVNFIKNIDVKKTI